MLFKKNGSTDMCSKVRKDPNASQYYNVSKQPILLTLHT
jgi:hypothetical protein